MFNAIKITRCVKKTIKYPKHLSNMTYDRKNLNQSLNYDMIDVL